MGIYSIKMTNPQPESRSVYVPGSGGVNVVDIYWTADSSGASFTEYLLTSYRASQARLGYAAPQSSKFLGRLVQVEYVKHTQAGVSSIGATPADNFDIKLRSAHTANDLCASKLMNLSVQNGKHVSGLDVWIGTDLMLEVKNAGGSSRKRAGRVRLWLE